MTLSCAAERRARALREAERAVVEAAMAWNDDEEGSAAHWLEKACDALAKAREAGGE